MRTLSNQTLPDKTSKSGSYPIIDIKNTITCSNEYNNVTFLNQDNIAIASENITFKIPPSEEPIPGDPCSEPSGGWFQTTGRRPVTWKGLTESQYGPGYDRMFQGTPLYQYFYVRVPYNWNYETNYGTSISDQPWFDWQFNVGYSMYNAQNSSTLGSGRYMWRYDSTNGLHLRERHYLDNNIWYIVYRIGKLSDWQCTGATPYKDNAVPLPCTFLITPNDYACGSYAALESGLGAVATPIDWTVVIDMPIPAEIPWNAPNSSPEAGPVSEIPVSLYCATASDPSFDHYQGYILQRLGNWGWYLVGGRYRTYNNTCTVYSSWLAWGVYSLNDRTNSLWYPSNNENCCFGTTTQEFCPPGVKEINGSAVVGSVLLTYKWEVLSEDFIALTVYDGAVFYYPTFMITSINYVTLQDSLNFGLTRPNTKSILVGTLGDGYFRITNGGLPTIYYCRNNGEINLYESSFYPWFT